MDKALQEDVAPMHGPEALRTNLKPDALVSIDGMQYRVVRNDWPFLKFIRLFPENGTEQKERRIMHAGDKIILAGVKLHVMSAIGNAYFRLRVVNPEANK